jgi:hypothetical protein
MLFLLRSQPLGGNSDDAMNDGIAVRKNLDGSNSQDGETTRGKPAIAGGIARWPIAEVMRLTIDLDDKTRGMAVKIRDVRTRRMLPAKLETRGPFTQREPDRYLGRRHRPAKLLRPRSRRPRSLQHI